MYVYRLLGNRELEHFVREKREAEVVVDMITVSGRVWLTMQLTWDARRCRYVPSRNASLSSP